MFNNYLDTLKAIYKTANVHYESNNMTRIMDLYQYEYDKYPTSDTLADFKPNKNLDFIKIDQAGKIGAIDLVQGYIDHYIIDSIKASALSNKDITNYVNQARFRYVLTKFTKSIDYTDNMSIDVSFMRSLDMTIKIEEGKMDRFKVFDDTIDFENSQDDTIEAKLYGENVLQSILNQTLVRDTNYPQYIYTEPGKTIDTLNTVSRCDYNKRPKQIRKTDRLVLLHETSTNEANDDGDCNVEMSTVERGINLKAVLRGNNNFYNVFLKDGVTNKYDDTDEYEVFNLQTSYPQLAALNAGYRVTLLTAWNDFMTNTYPKMISGKLKDKDILTKPIACILFTNLKGDKYYFSMPIQLTIFDIFNTCQIPVHHTNLYNCASGFNIIYKNLFKLPVVQLKFGELNQYITKDLFDLPKTEDFTFTAYSILTGDHIRHITFKDRTSRDDDVCLPHYLFSKVQDTDIRQKENNYLAYLARNTVEAVVDNKIKLDKNGYYHFPVLKMVTANKYWHNFKKRRINPKTPFSDYLKLMPAFYVNNNHFIKHSSGPNSLNHYYSNIYSYTLPTTYRAEIDGRNEKKKPEYEVLDSKEFNLNTSSDFTELDDTPDMSKLFTYLGLNKKHKYFVEKGHLISAYGENRINILKDWNLIDPIKDNE